MHHSDTTGDRRRTETRIYSEPLSNDFEIGGEISSRRFARSRQMRDCLRSELLYSDKRPRDLLFNAVEDILQHGNPGPMMLSRLTREAASRARLDAERAGFDFQHWDTAAKAVLNAMLMAGVLQSADGTLILPGVAAHATVVAALRPDYRDATEAFLLEFLIRRLGDVSTRDHTALAHALFRQFDPTVLIEDLEDRVVILMARLAGRIELRNEVYRAHDVPPA
jgi:hypothetical protein